MNLKNNTFGIAVIAGIISIMLSATSSRAQTNSDITTKELIVHTQASESFVREAIADAGYPAA